MRIKKLFAVLLTAVMLFSTLSMATFAADKPARLTVDSVASKPGDAVSINVSLENNPGISSASINVAYDEGLTLIGATNGDVFPGDISFIPPRQLTSVGEIKGNCNFAWQGIDIAEKDIKDGVMLTLRFRVSENARSGNEYKITVTSRSLDIVDRNLQCIKLNTPQGKVSINEDTSNPGDSNAFSKFIEVCTNWIRKIILMIKQLLLKQIG